MDVQDIELAIFWPMIVVFYDHWSQGTTWNQLPTWIGPKDACKKNYVGSSQERPFSVCYELGR
jgi:hypothetical protein